MTKDISENNTADSLESFGAIEITAEDVLDTRKLADKILVNFLGNDRETYPDIWNEDPEKIAAFNRESGLFDDERLYGRERYLD
ncbi:hypothetical protein [Fructobacillus papyrifericola]|uniref:Uncharacterized protein n=1 Tax=Fructobacillus papyrifericola TaxID=2713172 RepID=A0ABS5QTT2_9LACO|nr:hypothetical protein [Fructobacillus papyrifericola]MBS9335930.1 hypothetical protein [Fructobacillus papyrifericola]